MTDGFLPRRDSSCTFVRYMRHALCIMLMLCMVCIDTTLRYTLR